MAANFRTRPWIMPLVLRPLPSTPASRPATRITASYLASKNMSTTSRMCAKSASSRRQSKARKDYRANASNFESPSPVTQAMARPEAQQLPTEAIYMRAPHTFVTPPMSKYMFRPGEFLTLMRYRFVQHLKDAFNLAMYKISSKPGYFKGARFKLNRSSLVPTAKAMHVAMSEALARGDKDALRHVVVQRLYSQLAPSIDARKKGRRLEWSLVKYTRGHSYPRIVDHKIMMMQNPGGGPTAVWRQAVVAISSRQRLVEHDDNLAGVEVVGGTRETNALEYLIMVASVDGRTFETKDWKIFGYGEEATVDSWKEELRSIEEMEQDKLKKYKA